LKERGLIKAIGVSFTGLGFDDAAKVLSSPALDAVQAPGSLLDRRFEDAGFVLMQKQSIPVFVRGVYMQGLLVQETALPRLAAMQPALDIIGDIARRYHLSRNALCARYMLGVDGVTSLLMGVETLEQLKENLALIQQGALPPEIHQEIVQTLPLLPTEYLCPALWPKE
jgi:aryl-alcohol dehydrogenase-like predicted oxidoreductase